MKKNYSVLLALGLLAAACNGTGGGANSSNTNGNSGGNGPGNGGGGGNSDETIIRAVDPYIEGATFFYDANENNRIDEGEAISSPSDKQGISKFSIKIPANGKVIQLAKGRSGGHPFEGTLKAKIEENGTTNATPLTTLLAEGKTVDEIKTLLDEDFDEEKLKGNPMEDKDLLVASMSVHYASVVGSVTPEEIQKKKEVFSAIVEDLQPESVLKAVAVGEFIKKNGDAEFFDVNGVKADVIASVKTQLDAALNDENTQGLELVKDGASFSSRPIVSGVKIPAGNYDVIEISQVSFVERDSNAKIGQYWGAPQEIRLSFSPMAVDSDGRNSLFRSHEGDGWEVEYDLANSLIATKVHFSPEDGEEVDTYASWRNNNDFYVMATYGESGTGLFSIDKIGETYHIAGVEDLVTYWYGARYKEEEDIWVVDRSRTNNCIITEDFTDWGDFLFTEDCSKVDGRGKFVMLPEKTRIKEDLFVTKASEIDVPTSNSLKVKIGNEITTIAFNYSEEPVDLRVIERDEDCQDGCLKIGGETIYSSFGLSFNVNYYDDEDEEEENSIFPEGYKVLPIETSESIQTGFYKSGFILLVMKQGEDFEYILLNLRKRNGYAVKPAREVEGTLVYAHEIKDIDILEFLSAEDEEEDEEELP